MAVVQLKPIDKFTLREIAPLSKGVQTLINFINEHPHRKPKIVDISSGAKPFKIDSSWNFDVTIESKTKIYR